MDSQKQKIALVTGASGFVGSRLVRYLVCDGWEVHVVCRPESSLNQLAVVQDKISVHLNDGTTESLTKILQESKPCIVFHLASLFISEHQSRDVVPLVQSNLLFGAQLLEAMKQTGVKYIVNTGTSWQYYNSDIYNPANLYASTKQAFMDILRYYEDAHDFKAITLTLYDTYGKDDPRPKLMHMLNRTAETGECLAMSPGEQLIDLVHVDDVISAYMIASQGIMSELDWANGAYAVSSGSAIRLKDLVFLLSKIVGKEIRAEWGKRPYRAREVMAPWCKGRNLPEWHPRVSLEEGLASVFGQSHE